MSKYEMARLALLPIDDLLQEQQIWFRGKVLCTGATIRRALEDFADAVQDQDTGKPLSLKEIAQSHDIKCSIYALTQMYPVLQLALEHADLIRASSLSDLALDQLYPDLEGNEGRMLTDDRGNLTSPAVTLLYRRAEQMSRMAAAGNLRKYGTRNKIDLSQPTTLLDRQGASKLERITNVNQLDTINLIDLTPIGKADKMPAKVYGDLR